MFTALTALLSGFFWSNRLKPDETGTETVLKGGCITLESLLPLAKKYAHLYTGHLIRPMKIDMGQNKFGDKWVEDAQFVLRLHGSLLFVHYCPPGFSGFPGKDADKVLPNFLVAVYETGYDLKGKFFIEQLETLVPFNTVITVDNKIECELP